MALQSSPQEQVYRDLEGLLDTKLLSNFCFGGILGSRCFMYLAVWGPRKEELLYRMSTKDRSMCVCSLRRCSKSKGPRKILWTMSLCCGTTAHPNRKELTSSCHEAQTSKGEASSVTQWGAGERRGSCALRGVGPMMRTLCCR